MNGLNGWQRLWVMLMVIWALLVVLNYGYEGPTRVHHEIDSSAKPDYARMDYSVRKRMLTQWWEGADCDGQRLPNPGLHFEEVKDLPGLSTPVRLCFAVKISENERHRMDVIAGRMKAAREDEETIKLAVDEMERRAWQKPSALSPILTSIQVNAIKAEYARAYREELDSLRRNHHQEMAQVWLVPATVLYAFGWGVGWIRRGFRQSRHTGQA